MFYPALVATAIAPDSSVGGPSAASKAGQLRKQIVDFYLDEAENDESADDDALKPPAKTKRDWRFYLGKYVEVGILFELCYPSIVYTILWMSPIFLKKN